MDAMGDDDIDVNFKQPSAENMVAIDIDINIHQ